MIKKQIYKGLNNQEVKDKVIEEGFDPVLISNSPGYEYHIHVHPETKLLAIIDGNMSVVVKDESFICEKGDQLIIPGGVEHSAIVGAHGCSFYWSEKML